MADVGEGDDQLILHFNEAEQAAELARIIMDPQQLQAYIIGLQNEVAQLRNDQNRIEAANDQQVRHIENQVNVLDVQQQNNLPGLLPSIAPNMLLKIFTADDPSETWQDWLENFTLAARACNWDDPKKLRVLPAYLDGTAHEVYSTLDQGTQNNWDNLTTTFAQ